MNLLFVCNANRLRSPTAEAVFAHHPGVQAKSAGINTFAGTPLSGELIQWADIIFVMEEWQREEISLAYPAQLKGKRLICLDIPDIYGYMQPELVRLLQERVPEYLRG
jgi:predicted protein tyrosine phosphatase